MTTDTSPESAEQVASLLIRNVRALANSLQHQAAMKEDRAWTVAIKSILIAAGEGHGYEVLCCGVPGVDTHEWLLDLIWWQQYAEKGRRIVLGCESEWSGDADEVSWDFQKLLCIKAPLKLIIYGGGSTTENAFGRRVRDRLQSDLLAYADHREGEEYVFVSLDVSGGYAHRLRVPAGGRLAAADFKLLDLQDSEPGGRSR